MAKGRKALPGTYEARDFVVSDQYNVWLDSCPIKADGKARIDKAIHFGLGIKDKETYQKEKAEKIANLKAELGELE